MNDLLGTRDAPVSKIVSFKRPECMFFSQEELDFKDHAMKNHPMSNVFFNTFELNSFIEIKRKCVILHGLLDRWTSYWAIYRGLKN